MASQAVRLWEAVLDGLQAIGDGDNTRAGSVKEMLDKITSSSQQSKATWKRLLKDLQVGVRQTALQDSQYM
jgi:hypothetical protein